MNLTFFAGWPAFVEQVLFWSPLPSLDAAREAPRLIFDRITELEVSGAGAQQWLDLVAK